MCMCRPCRSAHGACVSRSMARGACARLEAELRARVAGEDRGVRVGDDARRDPDHHLGRAAPSASSLSISSKLSTTIRAPASAAARSSRADFALPCRMMRRPLKPALERQRELAARTRRRPPGPPPRTPAGPRCTGTPCRRTRPRRRPSRPGTPARGRAGRPRRRRRAACRTRVPARRASQPAHKKKVGRLLTAGEVRLLVLAVVTIITMIIISPRSKSHPGCELSPSSGTWSAC